jgi:hypothetical protein
MILRNAYKDDSVKTTWLPLGGALLVFGCAPALIATARDTWLWFGAIGAAGLVTALWRAGQAILQRRHLRPTLLVFFGTLLVSIPRVVGLWLLALAATYVYDALLRGTDASATTTESVFAGSLFFGALLLGIIFSDVSHRASLHRVYRDSLARCFAIRRNGSGLASGADVALSDVAPPQRGSARSFPRLLVCATANVRWRTGKEWHTFVPFVFSHDRCGVPTVPGASFDTRTLECGRVPRAILHRGDEPLVSLMTRCGDDGGGSLAEHGTQDHRGDPTARRCFESTAGPLAAQSAERARPERHRNPHIAVEGLQGNFARARLGRVRARDVRAPPDRRAPRLRQ